MRSASAEEGGESMSDEQTYTKAQIITALKLLRFRGNSTPLERYGNEALKSFEDTFDLVMEEATGVRAIQTWHSCMNDLPLPGVEVLICNLSGEDFVIGHMRHSADKWPDFFWEVGECDYLYSAIEYPFWRDLESLRP